MKIIGCYNYSDIELIPCNYCILKSGSDECGKFLKDDEMVLVWNI